MKSQKESLRRAPFPLLFVTAVADYLCSSVLFCSDCCCCRRRRQMFFSLSLSAEALVCTGFSLPPLGEFRFQQLHIAETTAAASERCAESA